MEVGADTDEPRDRYDDPTTARQALMVIALASAALSTAPVHAQEPSPTTTPGTVTAATPLPRS